MTVCVRMRVRVGIRVRVDKGACVWVRASVGGRCDGAVDGKSR